VPTHGRGDSGDKSHAADRRRRYEPRAVYYLAESLRRQGVELAKRSGPWRAVAKALNRPGRNRVAVLPIVTNGLAQVMVDTMEHATDLAGLLNWCGIEELDPVADLIPPPALQV
jgi:hypothetical protein